MNMKNLGFILCLLFGAKSAFSSEIPNCIGAEKWPAAMAFATLKNEQILDIEKLDFDKTKVDRVASEKIGRDQDYHANLYRQVHHVSFVEKTGRVIEVLTVSNATRVECSMGGVDIYLIQEKLKK